MESQERGWDAPEKYVCANCFEDQHLKAVAEANAEELNCDYCGAESDALPIAAPLSALMEAIAPAFLAYYADPTSAGLPRDSGEWVGEERFTDTVDGLLSLPLNCEDDLFEDIARSFHNDVWYPCAGGSWLEIHKHDELNSSWEDFVGQIKHQSRFFFKGVHLLDEIGKMVKQLGLIRHLPHHSRLFRVRWLSGAERCETFDQIGPPSPDRATAGRMNPAGISYFYLAYDPTTARTEVAPSQSTRGALGTFVTTQAILVVDLTTLPEAPSVFDRARSDQREVIMFLEGFVEAITKPVERDGREHVDYVPSQVVCEFFAQHFSNEDEEAVRGIVYPSAVANDGTNFVMFPPRSFSEKLSDFFALESIQKITP